VGWARSPPQPSAEQKGLPSRMAGKARGKPVVRHLLSAKARKRRAEVGILARAGTRRALPLQLRDSAGLPTCGHRLPLGGQRIRATGHLSPRGRSICAQSIDRGEQAVKQRVLRTIGRGCRCFRQQAALAFPRRTCLTPLPVCARSDAFSCTAQWGRGGGCSGQWRCAVACVPSRRSLASLNSLQASA